MNICVSVVDMPIQSREGSKKVVNYLIEIKLSGRISLYGHATELAHAKVLRSAHQKELRHISPQPQTILGKFFGGSDYRLSERALVVGWSGLEPMLAAAHLASNFWEDLTNVHFPKTDS